MTKAFVVGHPVAHSRSPVIHGFWLAEHGIAGRYERVLASPAEFPAFVRDFAGAGYAGGNVTIPHKEAAFAATARRTARAERLRAVNTLWLEDGVLCGDNTDILGFMAHLDHSLGSGWERRVATALVIGGGGAARAIVAGLQERPLDRILIANRSEERAGDIVADLATFGSARLSAMALGEVAGAMADVDLVVNTTSLGMAGQPALDLDLSPLPEWSVVADAVYVPLETPLLAAAAARGLATVDGLGMLLHQAVPGFARWFGVTPTVTPALRAAVVADLEAAH